jgi:NADPH:quinone reductase-like Zn-dependent oxidoreductase
MRTWQIEGAFGLEHLKPAERPRPDPRPGQVLVRIAAASLNYRDTLMVRGSYGARIALPLVPLSDGAGEVVATGPGVRRVRVGDKVAPLFFQEWFGGPPDQDKFFASLGGPLDGVLQEVMCLSEHGVARVPAHLSAVEAACLPCAGLTAWSAILGQGQVRPGQTVVVQGTGGVALFALQFAKAAGARVILTSSSDGKLARGRTLGADETINYRTTPDWDKAVKDLTQGAGADHIVELAGGGGLDRSIRAARTGGTISLIGVLEGAKAPVTLPLVVMRNLRLQGITVGSRDDFEAMVRAIEQCGLRPVVDRTFPFDRVPDAFRSFEADRPFGKVAISS